MADLRIDLAAEFRGRKAFKEADKAVSSLDRAVGKLGKQIASVFAAQKIYAFGKASVKAFAEDQASAARLAKTVDNLGLSFANPAIDQFIKKLEMSSGIVDETLRPAFQALLTTTGDVSKSMNLLTSAIDISRGSGVDLATVTQDLANGYVGITRGLKKYNLGLSQAQLKSKSFAEIMSLLNKQFSGASATYLNTYSGKIDILKTAADNAKETIGKGLVDALIGLGGQDANVQNVATAMQNAADATANFARGIGVLIGEIKKIPGLNQLVKLFEFSARYSPASLIAKLGKPKTAPAGGYGVGTGTVADYQRQQNEKAAAKAKLAADKKAAVLAASQLKTQKTLTAEQKKQAALKREGTVFDLQQIELVAALKGKLSDDERKRVEAQLALLNGNEAEAKKLTDQILMAQDSTGNLSKLLASLPDAKNPFQYLDGYLNGLAMKAQALGAATINGASAVTSVNPSSTNDSFSVLASQGAGASGGFSSVVAAAMAAGSSQPVINVTVQGSVIKEQELIAQIQNGTQLASLSGSPSQIGRIAGMFG